MPTAPRSGDAVPPDHTPEGLSGSAVGGVLWQGLSFMLGRGFTLIATVALARLLTPGEFGLVGLALVFISFAEYVNDLGVSQGLIYLRRERGNDDGAVTISLASGVILCLAGLLAAPLIGDFFHEPAVVPMVRVLSVSLLVSALRQVPDALLRKELHFRRRVITEVSRAVVQGGVSVGLAAAGLGAWSIVWGYIAGGITWCVTAWLLVDYRPSLGFWRSDRAVMRRLLAYGAPAAAQGLLAALVFDIDYVVVGNILGANALGVYTLAFRLPQLAIINVFFVLSTVAFPMYSRARESPDRLKVGYLTALRLQCVYGVAAAVGLFMVAPMLVPVVFGAKWAAAVVPLQALALYAGFRSLGAGAADLYKGVGRPGLAAGIALLRLAVLLPALLLAAQTGIEAVAWTQAGLALLFAMVMQGIASRVLDLRAGDFVRALRPALAVAAGTGLGAGAIRWLVPGADSIRLVLATLLGAGLGFAAVWLADAGFVREAKALVMRRSNTPAVAQA